MLKLEKSFDIFDNNAMHISPRVYSDLFYNYSQKLVDTYRNNEVGEAECFKRKKVTFADEKGKTLCYVKFFVPESTTVCYRPNYGPTSIFEDKMEYKIAYNETQLHLKNVSLLLYGLTANKNLFGAVAVRNLAFKKDVKIRLTLNKWKTFQDIPCKFMQQEFHGDIDRFIFVTHLLTLGHDISSNQKGIEFAVCYSVNNDEHWDNNANHNYKL
ncbi:protein phosphatase 1 regulatory subunit 3B [Hydra vulgaris]|uniref:Protein phosphatase 1 regulatory subunit 3B n=1 Tax=Hydra vulgaris TaxID=6087 RepID=A0ABM4BIP1_HYDVU